jgi:hypothetical protein
MAASLARVAKNLFDQLCVYWFADAVRREWHEARLTIQM